MDGVVPTLRKHHYLRIALRRIGKGTWPDYAIEHSCSSVSPAPAAFRVGGETRCVSGVTACDAGPAGAGMSTRYT
jgi:hypothetical protein